MMVMYQSVAHIAVQQVLHMHCFLISGGMWLPSALLWNITQSSVPISCSMCHVVAYTLCALVVLMWNADPLSTCIIFSLATVEVVPVAYLAEVKNLSVRLRSAPRNSPQLHIHLNACRPVNCMSQSLMFRHDIVSAPLCSGSPLAAPANSTPIMNAAVSLRQHLPLGPSDRSK